ncbi:vasotab [Drosophila novamexicana]|uniref:vasotab n=1 Tax=Drosophila novamexicana TaxID=47314 RepID=UPI0011E5E1C6|nr:vasotab [Drosophila novamexicana]
MKFCFALINLLLCCGIIMAADRCPTICPAIYKPVCGEALVGGQRVRCQFSNSCAMAGNSCTKGINWRETPNCNGLSGRCGSLLS